MELAPEAVAAGVRLIAHARVGSTNTEALALARAGERGAVWVTAGEQTAGRGRRGRDWHSPAGNLHASLLVIEPCAPQSAAQLSFVAALALYDAVLEVGVGLSERLRFKWPNDLLLDRSKFAGILVEGETLPDRCMAVTIGIGMNCIAAPAQTPYPATSLREAGIHAAAEAVFQPLSAKMLRRMAQWRSGSDFCSIRNDWLARALPVGEPIRIRSAETEVEGQFRDIDPEGRLLLGLVDGTVQAFTAGEIIAAGLTDHLRRSESRDALRR
ncbi:MAG TPA: biotin--[acetyl-CoA-carboxylase] ligase [Xanthobacteraceae bacterium]|nr:biotin--[acetyl-CoA-carboxylase] ligase [Xanthobacteraceae bacterium]